MAATLTLSHPEPGIAVLTFDTPDKSANVLSRPVLEELNAHLDTLEQRNDLEGLIIISGKPGQFIAGADLNEFVTSLGISKEEIVTMCRAGQDLFARLSKCPFVTVSAIDGICVGGGAELAAWCDRRVMSNNKKTQFGFPEVKLGLFPGWGGTVRAPRIVGLGNAVEMITGGESITAEDAYAMGWVSDVVPADQLLAAAVAVVRDEQETQNYLQDRKSWDGPIDVSPTERMFLGATASALIQQHTKGHYPAPAAALNIMLEAAGAATDKALQMEAEGMSELFGSPINAALLNIFFLTDRNKKDTGVAAGVVPDEITSVGVIGSGIMGAGIASANVKRQIPVTITDISTEALGRGVQTILKEVSYNRATKSADVDRAVEFAPFINGTISDVELAACDIVIEAAVENADIKKQIFDRIESQLTEHTILASNTSTIPISLLAAELRRPEQFCGIHFFNPVRKMKLVEVIRGKETNDQTMATAVAYAKSIGKMPIVVNDGPGFLVNRLLLPYMNEALQVVIEGASIKDVEASAKNFGMPMGPITLYDVVGLDTALYAGKVLVESFPDRFEANMILPTLVEAGRLGQKSGKGFFDYNNKKNRAQPDPDLDQYLQPHLSTSPTEFGKKELTNRLFLPMLVEASRVMEEQLVRDARDVDLGLIFGIGFPPFKGGLMHWADTLGASKILEMLKPFEDLGKRYQPTELMKELGANNRKYYDLHK